MAGRKRRIVLLAVPMQETALAPIEAVIVEIVADHAPGTAQGRSGRADEQIVAADDVVHRFGRRLDRSNTPLLRLFDFTCGSTYETCFGEGEAPAEPFSPRFSARQEPRPPGWTCVERNSNSRTTGMYIKKRMP